MAQRALRPFQWEKSLGAKLTKSELIHRWRSSAFDKAEGEELVTYFVSAIFPRPSKTKDGSIPIGQPSFWSALEGQLLKVLPRLTASQISRLIWVASKQKFQNAQVLEGLSSAVVSSLATFSAKDASLSLNGLSSLNWKPSAQFLGDIGEFLKSIRFDEPSYLVLILNAFSRWRYKNEATLLLIEEHLTAQLTNLSLIDLVTIYSSMATLQYSGNRLFPQLVLLIPGFLEDLNCRDIATLLLAIDRLKLAQHSHVVLLLLGHAKNKVKSFDPHALAMFLGALTNMKVEDHALFNELGALCVHWAQTQNQEFLEDANLAGICRAFSHARNWESKSFWEAILKLIEEKPVPASSRHGLRLAKSLCKAQLMTEKLLHCLINRLDFSSLNSLDLNDLFYIAWFAHLRVPPPVLDRLAIIIHTMDPAHLAQCVITLVDQEVDLRYWRLISKHINHNKCTLSVKASLFKCFAYLKQTFPLENFVDLETLKAEIMQMQTLLKPADLCTTYVSLANLGETHLLSDTCRQQVTKMNAKDLILLIGAASRPDFEFFFQELLDRRIRWTPESFIRICDVLHRREDSPMKEDFETQIPEILDTFSGQDFLTLFGKSWGCFADKSLLSKLIAKLWSFSLTFNRLDKLKILDMLSRLHLRDLEKITWITGSLEPETPQEAGKLIGCLSSLDVRSDPYWDFLKGYALLNDKEARMILRNLATCPKGSQSSVQHLLFEKLLNDLNWQSTKDRRHLAIIFYALGSPHLKFNTLKKLSTLLENTPPADGFSSNSFLHQSVSQNLRNVIPSFVEEVDLALPYSCDIFIPAFSYLEDVSCGGLQTPPSIPSISERVF